LQGGLASFANKSGTRCIDTGEQQKALVMRFSESFRGALFLVAIAIAAPAAAQAPAAYWCEPAHAYFPQVASCPVPWGTTTSTYPAQPAAPPWVPYNTQYAPYDNYNHKGGE
jgi:hypothetical protein